MTKRQGSPLRSAVGCRWTRRGIVLLGLVLGAVSALPAAAPIADPQGAQVSGFGDVPPDPDVSLQWQGIRQALKRLPLAATLGAVLAFRPRRRGTPPRSPAVIQTQIILALVGSVVMLVVGSSVARAFAIVGAASLVRYRAKIDDPKDAGVMLSTLGIGLASGVGLYFLAVFATFFIMAVVWILESLAPEEHKLFNLKIKSKELGKLRPAIQTILRRNEARFELRSSSDEEVVYEVRLPVPRKTDRITSAIHDLDPQDESSVEWEEKKQPKSK